MLALGVCADDRGRHVDRLEADHEVGGAQIVAGQRTGAMGHEVEVVAGSELERLRERVPGGQVHRSEGLDANREPVGVAAEDRFGDRAAEAVAAADDHDVELVAHGRRTLATRSYRSR